MRRFQSDWLSTAQGMQKEMERLLDYLGGSKPPSVRFGRMWEPLVDVYETATDVVVLVDLAAVKRDEIEIVVDGKSLVVRGFRRETSAHAKRNYYQMEVHRGPFERSIRLPATVDPEKTKASYQDGLLEIVLAKLREERTVTVTIKTLSQL